MKLFLLLFWISIAIGVLAHILFPRALYVGGNALKIFVICASAAALGLLDCSRGFSRRQPRDLSFILAFCLCIAGCTALGLSTPQSFDEQLAEAYGVHTAVVEATATAVTAHSITVGEAQAVQTQAEGARALLDAAHAAESSNLPSATSDLQLATSALTAIQAYLNSVKAAPTGAASSPN